MPGKCALLRSKQINAEVLAYSFKELMTDRECAIVLGFMHYAFLFLLLNRLGLFDNVPIRCSHGEIIDILNDFKNDPTNFSNPGARYIESVLVKQKRIKEK